MENISPRLAEDNGAPFCARSWTSFRLGSLGEVRLDSVSSVLSVEIFLFGAQCHALHLLSNRILPFGNFVLGI